jgi:hypothetical protein
MRIGTLTSRVGSGAGSRDGGSVVGTVRTAVVALGDDEHAAAANPAKSVARASDRPPSKSRMECATTPGDARKRL